MNVAAALLEAFAHVLASRIEGVRRDLEIEAAGDAIKYQRAVSFDGEETPAEQWAIDAFDSWLADAGADAIAPLDAEAARAIYCAAFARALKGK